MTVKEYADYIINGNNLTKEEVLLLAEADIDELAHEADRLRKHFCGNSFDMCTIINAKSGKCSENCKYCAQSSYYSTEVEEYPLLPAGDIVNEAKRNEKQGVLRFSIVTSGRRLTDSEVDNVCESYRLIKKETGIEVCASHGLLDEQQFRKLKEAGVTRIHNNLETSRRNFANICTTHTYDDKIEAIQAAMRAGIHVCSGGIIGMGETMEDRIDMILDIRSLGIRSVPVNILNPIPGTPYEKLDRITYDEIIRTIAVFRFVNPQASIRMAGGRGLLPDKGRRAFVSGANAAISGDMLTTAGITVAADLEMINELGYEVRMDYE